MATKKYIVNGRVFKDTATKKVLINGRIVMLKGGTAPEPPATGDNLWMSWL